MRRTGFLMLAALFAVLLCGPAEAQWCHDQDQTWWCGDPDDCRLCSTEAWSCDRSCKRFGSWSTCGEAQGNPANDLDGDGDLNTADNCLCTPNADQADCDGDNVGSACDLENAVYQQVSNQRCWIDRDVHATHYDLEDYWERRYVDVSSCAAADKYVRYKNNEATCAGFPPPSVYECCTELIVNDAWWCTRVDQNFCH